MLRTETHRGVRHQNLKTLQPVQQPRKIILRLVRSTLRSSDHPPDLLNTG